jgi:hypothetical protein
MVRTVQTPSGPARVEAIVMPPKEGMSMTGFSVPVRLARVGYAVLSSIFVACVLVQVFFAGMGAFGAGPLRLPLQQPRTRGHDDDGQLRGRLRVPPAAPDVSRQIVRQ